MENSGLVVPTLVKPCWALDRKPIALAIPPINMIIFSSLLTYLVQRLRRTVLTEYLSFECCEFWKRRFSFWRSKMFLHLLVCKLYCKSKQLSAKRVRFDSLLLALTSVIDFNWTRFNNSLLLTITGLWCAATMSKNCFGEFVCLNQLWEALGEKHEFLKSHI